MQHNKDILWKGVLQWVLDDLLRFVFPNADQVFYFQKKFGYLDKELAELNPGPGKKTDVRSVDNLVKVFRKDGRGVDTDPYRSAGSNKGEGAAFVP